MRIIGLTGGIASGKSAVAGRLREHGAIVIDADQVAREVVEPGEPALEEIRARFGDGVIDAEGRLDRPALGAIVFGDPEARRALEAITHPAIGRRTRERIARAEAADPDAVVVYDVPLLAESAPEGRLRFDHVVVVRAAVEERIRRMVEIRGMRREEAERRIAAQADDAARLALADTVIDADGALEDTLARVDAAWPAISGASR